MPSLIPRCRLATGFCLAAWLPLLICVGAQRSNQCSAVLNPSIPDGTAVTGSASGFALEEDCSWNPGAAYGEARASPQHVWVVGQQQQAPASELTVIARVGSPPAIVCSPDQPASTPGSAGHSLHLVNVVLVNCSLPAPGGGPGDALRPQGLLPPDTAAANSTQRLYLQDVRLLVDAKTLQEHIKFFSAFVTPDVWTSMWIYTDGVSFLHVTWWSNGATTWQAVGLLLADSLQTARATGIPPGQAAAAAGGHRRALQVGQGAPGAPATPLNYVLWSDNSTIVQQLGSHGIVNTSVPFLLYQSANVTIGAAQVPKMGIPINRRWYWVGLTSANTSLDLHMDVNQLLLTGRWSNLTSDHLALENLGPGDERSALIAAPISTSCYNCMWYLYYDRKTVRHRAVNSTVVVQPADINAMLYWSSVVNAGMLTFLRGPTSFLRDVYKFSVIDVEMQKPGVSVWIERGQSSAAISFKLLATIDPVVAPKLPLPTPLGANTETDASGISPFVASATGIAEVQALLTKPLEPVVRSRMILQLGNMTMAAQREPLQVTCNVALMAPFGTVDPHISVTRLNLTGSAALIVLPDDAPVSSLSPQQPSNNTIAAASGSCFTIQYISLMGLAQGPAARAASNVSDPSVWTLLLWGVGRKVKAGGRPLGLITTALTLPGPEYDYLHQAASQSGTIALPLTGGYDMVLTGATVGGPDRMYVRSMQGSGLLGTNITLLREDQGLRASDGYFWPGGASFDTGHGVAGFGSDGSSRGSVNTPVVAAAVSCAGLLLLAMVVGAAVWYRRQRQCQAAGGAEGKHADLLDVQPGAGSDQGATALAAAESGLAVAGLEQSHSRGPGPASSEGSPVLSGSQLSGGLFGRRRSASGSSYGAKMSSAWARVHAAIGQLAGRMQAARQPPATAGLSSKGGPRWLSSSLAGSSGLGSPNGSGPAGSSTAGKDEVKVLGLLGRGTFSTVYKGVWRGRLVAIKVLHVSNRQVVDQLVSSCRLTPSQGRDSKLEQMAVTEVAMSSSLKHPNIVQMYTYSLAPVEAEPGSMGSSAGTSDDCNGILGKDVVKPAGSSSSSSGGGCGALGWELRLLMEYCDQGTLRDALDKGTLLSTNSSTAQPSGLPDLHLVLPLALDITSALLHLHSEGVLHGDLKAQNVLLTHGTGVHAAGCEGAGCVEGAPGQLRLVAKVADFGLSLALEPEATHISHVHGGTLTHMAPELLLAGHASKASDVYAAGVLLWELLTGQRPYQGMGPALLPVLVAQQGVRPSWPPAAQQVLPPGLIQLVEAAWAQDAAARPDAASMWQRLQQLQEEVMWQHVFSAAQSRQHA